MHVACHRQLVRDRRRPCIARGSRGSSLASGQQQMPTLFPPEWPAGFRYEEAFVDPAAAARLAAAAAEVRFSTFEMHGVAARRRVAFFGQTYGDRAAGPIPPFLLPLRAQAARWAGVAPDDFAMALINQYPPGAPIGWHRDAPQYGIIVGVSLLSPCRMKLRPYVSPGQSRVPGSPPRRATHEIVLEPRSIYLIAGRARRDYEHSIPAGTALRYSITFRTLRRAS